jgi:hypothetical protein
MSGVKFSPLITVYGIGAGAIMGLLVSTGLLLDHWSMVRISEPWLTYAFLWITGNALSVLLALVTRMRTRARTGTAPVPLCPFCQSQMDATELMCVQHGPYKKQGIEMVRRV